MKAVILAGGIGSRLWPLSRELYPKQLLQLTSNLSLLQVTVQRAIKAGIKDLVLVASHAHRFYIREQLDELNLDKHISVKILLEPQGKNTAAAIALAAMESDLDDCLWVMPADHVLQDDELPQKLALAQLLCVQGKLVTFGIEPRSPETGYGYIQRGKQVAENEQAYCVQGFKEKPNLALAEQYLAAGDYYWNSGLFCFQAQSILKELKRYRPDIFEACGRTFAGRYLDLDFIKFPEDVFALCPDESIDYAVMEKTQHAVVIPLSGHWSDIGSWNALYELESKDAYGNACSGDVIAVDTSNSMIKSTSRLVATVGVADLIVVETPDALLVADRHQDQAIKSLVSKLKAEHREERIAPRRVLRPWGYYEVLDKQADYEIRLVTVKPGGKIGEHQHDGIVKQWSVLSGEGLLRLAESQRTLKFSENIEIPKNYQHSIINDASFEMKILEIKKFIQCKQTESV